MKLIVACVLLVQASSPAMAQGYYRDRVYEMEEQRQRAEAQQRELRNQQQHFEAERARREYEIRAEEQRRDLQRQENYLIRERGYRR